LYWLNANFTVEKKHLIELVWVGQQFIVIQLHDEGDLCAYLRATTPRTPHVEATALHPPSTASFTMFSASK